MLKLYINRKEFLTEIKLFLGLCSSFFGLLSSSAHTALTAFDDSVSHSTCDELNSADSVVVARDNVVNLVRIAVGIYDCNDRNTELLSFGNSNSFLSRVNNEQCARELFQACLWKMPVPSRSAMY